MTYEEYCNRMTATCPNAVPMERETFDIYAEHVRYEQVLTEDEFVRAPTKVQYYIVRLIQEKDAATCRILESNGVIKNIKGERDAAQRECDNLRRQVETADAKVAQLEDALSDANAVLEKFAEKDPEDEKAVVPSPTQGDAYRQLAETLDQLTETAFCVAREMAHIREGK